MNVKIVIFLVTIAFTIVNADFYFNPVLPKKEDLNNLNLKCIRGRTTIKVRERIQSVNDDTSEEDDGYRRSHMNFGATDSETCEICVCSVDGKDEYCSKRPAMNVNECIRMAKINDDHNRNVPFDVDSVLSSRVRRRGGVQQCVPFVSQYTTCTDENSCSGCKECRCDESGQWACQDVTRCLGMDSRDLNENSVDLAWQTIEDGFKKKTRDDAARFGSPHVPRPGSNYDDELIGDIDKEKYVDSDVDPSSVPNVKVFMNSQLDFMKDGLVDRFKRSLLNKNKTKDAHPIKFYHAVDELNEDTLQHSNNSGTIAAKKAIPLPASRRSGRVDVSNSSNPLHIEYKLPLNDYHITDNKIDSIHNNEKKDIVNDKNHDFMGNRTTEVKDKELSKLIVNELKKGTEVVGDKNSPLISNITFTRENDTLTAMAFIAGNLLNKLWNLEKDNQGDSMESQVLKHEKISDLVDLFKAPLTIRQETFLKDALEHLAGVMSKGDDDKNNIPLCDQVARIKENLGISANCTQRKNLNKEELNPEKVKTKGDHIEKVRRAEVTNDATLAAVKKLDNVMTLIQKYEEVQKNINNFKTPSTKEDVKNTSSKNGPNAADFLSGSENQSLNVFGNVLEKVTKLLVPEQKQKNIVKSIRNKNILRKDEDLKTKLKRIYDIDLENSTFTSKDKVVLDYLVNLRNTNCELVHNVYDTQMPGGDIIQNLSEFLKVKSFVDLLKLLEPEKTTTTTESSSNKNILRSNQIEITEPPVLSTTQTKETTAVPPTTTDSQLSVSDNLAQTKEKLKLHLKAIVGDLLELQKASGISVKDSNIKLAEALPCLYNILNSNKLAEDKTKLRINKIKTVFDAIKEELKFNPETRRAFKVFEPRPKSAAVWERVIKNTQQLNSRTRKFIEYQEPKSFDELESLMRSLDNNNNAYKNTAISKGVSPEKRLDLVKTIDVDARLYMAVIENIKLYLDEPKTLSLSKSSKINNFLKKVSLNLKLDEDVLNSLYKHKQNEIQLPRTYNYKYELAKKRSEAIKTPANIKPKSAKVSRDEIINQLIKNRVQFYLKIKELEGFNKEDDVNVRLARKILNYLETKNYSLARELFKVFVATKQINKTDSNPFPSLSTVQPSPRGMLIALKEPLIQFEEDKSPGMGPDMISLTKSLMKQLSNIKNMRTNESEYLRNTLNSAKSG
ncbi:uncharacterized protein LOC106140597 [Amyelois transitella]|uniref:uncharacterized protein LOC106140597 n=1 Tax=Amyelois transitella TaxID=680683 RepID=UPI00298F9B83|nr:uncharacterized protein LOC106140597 [Amyelois transitella]